MANGYTRQRAANIVTGGVISADDFNAEYNAIEGAFNASSGHNHDGTAGGGAPIEKIGPSNDYEFDSNAFFPKTGATSLDIGKSGQKFDNAFFGGQVQCNTLLVDTDATINDELTVAGTTVLNASVTLGDAATDTLSVNALVNTDFLPSVNTVNLGSASIGWNNLYVEGTADIETVDIEAGAIDGTTIGAATPSTGAFTTLDASGATTLATTLDVTGATTLSSTLDVTGATGIDGDFDINTDKVTVAAATGNTVIAGTLDVTGAVTLADDLAVTGDTTLTGTLDATGEITATGGVVGDLTGDIKADDGTVIIQNGATSAATTFTGSLTGDVTGDLKADDGTVVFDNGATGADAILTGQLKGDVQAADGTVVFDSGTDGSDAALTGNVTGDLTGSVKADDGTVVLDPGTDGSDSTITVNNITISGAISQSGGGSFNADTATALATARTIAGQSFDGTANIDIAPTDLTGVTADATEINKLDGLTATTAELNTIAGLTADTTELNKLDGLTATTAELNLLDGTTAGTITASKAAAYNSSGELAANAIDLQDNWKIEATASYFKIIYNGTVVMRLSTAGAAEFRDDVTAYDTSIT